MRSCTAVATLLTFWPPGPVEARNFSSTIASSGNSATAEPGIMETHRQRRGGGDIVLALARDRQFHRMEPHRRPTPAINRIAQHRHAQPLGGMDADLMGAARLGIKGDKALAALALHHLVA